jgi:hypothetical protein
MVVVMHDGIENEHGGIGNDDGDDDIDHDDQMVVMMIDDEDNNDDCPFDFIYTFNYLSPFLLPF